MKRTHPMERKAPAVQEVAPHRRKAGQKPWALQIIHNASCPRFIRWLGPNEWTTTRRYRNERDAMEALRGFHHFHLWDARVLDPDGVVRGIRTAAMNVK